MRADCYLSRLGSFLNLTILIVTTFSASPAHADAVVTSCTRGAFNTALATGGKITFDCGAGPHTILLGLPSPISSGKITIDGGGTITLKASNTNHFKVSDGATLELVNITLTNGKAMSGGAIENSGTTSVTGVTFANNTATEEGGAIFNKGALTVSKSTFTNNTATQGGGAILNRGMLTVRQSAFTQNIAAGGGAIANDDEGRATVEASEFNENQGGAIGNGFLARGITITGSMFSDNFSPGNGGALANVSIFAPVTVTLSTFSGNVAADSGGAIFNTRSLTVEKSTLIGNQAGSKGGGIYFFGDPGMTLDLIGTTLNGNAAFEGGGIYADGHELATTRYTNCTLCGNASEAGGSGIFHKTGIVFMSFSTIASNRGGAGLHVEGGDLGISNTLLSNNSTNCAIIVTSALRAGFNLSSDTSCPFRDLGNINNQDAKLGPLANNGGPTLTHLPQPGSPAINAARAAIDTDQRGVKRPRGPNPDIGSVEAQ